MADTPEWSDFAEFPVDEFRSAAPAAELAAVLQHYRTDLDEAAQAGIDGRAQGLRGLAEQAVLVIELEKVLERYATRMDVATADAGLGEALRGLKDRMLAQIAACGLEIVRLRGACAGAVVDIAEVECWRYDEAHTTEVVIEELEAAVRLDGVLLRLGRVVMGAAGDAAPPQAAAVADSSSRKRCARIKPASTAKSTSGIICPVADCGVENDARAEVCVGCLTLLVEYRRLSMHPQALFNRGLRAARAGDCTAAREHFAAIMLWHADDIMTRNAYALACLDAGDGQTAQRVWEEVLTHLPGEPLAVRGLAALLRARTACSP
jgi:hypothetical protein